MTITVGIKCLTFNCCKLCSNSTFSPTHIWCPITALYSWIMVNPCKANIFDAANRRFASMLSTEYKPINSVRSCSLESTYRKLIINCSLFEQSMHSSAMVLNNPPSQMFWPMSWRILCAISLRMVSWISWAVYLLDFLLNHLSTTASALCKCNSWIKSLSVSTFLPLKCNPW